MKRNTKLLLTLSLIGTTLFSCSSNVAPVNGVKQENQQTEVTEAFNIVNATSDYAYLDGLPEKGTAGETYSFIVSLKPGYHFNDKVTVLSGETPVEVTFANGRYSFVMPESDVSVAVDVGKTDFTITNTSMFIEKVLIDDDSEEETSVRSVTSGTALKFEALPNDDFYFTEVKINGKEVEEGEDGYYHFIMPNKPVVISSDKIAVPYNVDIKSELTLSSLNVYTNTETKQAVTQAIKGDKVYLDFTYLSEETLRVKYTIEVSTLNEDDLIDGKLEVTQIENTNTFTFDMVSKNVAITIVEKDCTPFMNSTIINKEWKTYNMYGSNNKVESKKYSDLSGNKYTFDDEGNATTVGWGTTKTTWEADLENPNHLTYKTTSGNKNVYFTDHLFVTPFNDYNNNFTDAYAGLYSDEYELHAIIFDKNYRVVWIEDETGAIIENLFVKNEDVYANTTIKKEDGSLALGSDLTLNANFMIYDNDELLCTVLSGKAKFVSAITTELDEYVSVEVTNADGEAITSAENGETITVKVNLSSDAPDGIALRKINVLSGGTAVTVTADATEENKYTFTMPINSVVIKATTKDNNKYLNYPVLGEYTTYNLCKSASSDKTFTSEAGLVKWTFASDGSILKKATYTTNEYIIESVDNAEEGLLTAVDSTGVTHANIYFGNGIIVTPYGFGKTEFTDVLIGLRLPQGTTMTDVRTVNHFSISSDDTWAISFYLSDALFGSVFCYKNAIYMGVEFTYDEGSTRINSTSSYHVVKNGVTLFDVSNNNVTVHED